MEPIHSVTLSNGLIISVYDQTKPYFGDYFHVKIEIRLIPPENCFATEGDNNSQSYSKIIRKMGVPSDAVTIERQKLIDDFITTSLPYLSLTDTPVRIADKIVSSKTLSDRRYRPSGY